MRRKPVIFTYGGRTLLGETDPDIPPSRQGYLVVKCRRIAYEVPVERIKFISKHTKEKLQCTQDINYRRSLPKSAQA